MKASDIISNVFSSLLRLIEQERIRPGSQEERDYLKTNCENQLYSFMLAHNIERPPTVSVYWSNSVFSDPDEIKIAVDEITKLALQKRGIW
jgi:hypothetical protein